MKQLTIFDCMPTMAQEPAIGEIVDEAGANIPHVMRPSYIGRKVLCPIFNGRYMAWQCGILEQYVEHESGRMRSVIYTGKKQRSLVTHYDGIEIHEPLPWDAYEARNKAIGRNAK